MLKSTLFGTQTELFTENKQRYIDEDNDIYPPPLMTRSPSHKAEGFMKIWYPMVYLKPNRVRQLLIECQKEKNESGFKINETNYYGLNLIAMICQENMGGNIMYSDNKLLYEELFFVLMKNINTTNLELLFNDILTKKPIYSTDKLMIEILLEELIDAEKYHMLIVLWNYGLKYTKEILKSLKSSVLVSMLSQTCDSFFISGKRYYLILKDCPITLKSITKPAILNDGTVYEYNAIKEHLLKKDTNPLTNELMKTKILYLPENGSFEHFNLLENMCTICNEEMFKEHTLTAPCKHIFHSYCIRSLYPSKCPKCSVSLPCGHQLFFKIKKIDSRTLTFNSWKTDTWEDAARFVASKQGGTFSSRFIKDFLFCGKPMDRNMKVIDSPPQKESTLWIDFTSNVKVD